MKHVSETMVARILQLLDSFDEDLHSGPDARYTGLSHIPVQMLQAIRAEAMALGWIAGRSAPTGPISPPAGGVTADQLATIQRRWMGAPPAAPSFNGPPTGEKANATNVKPAVHSNDIPGIPASQLLTQIKALVNVAETEEMKKLYDEIESWRKLSAEKDKDIDKLKARISTARAGLE